MGNPNFSSRPVLLLPFFNESKRFNEQYLSKLLFEISKLGWGVLLVNDGSTDDTLAKLIKLSEVSGVDILDLQQNEGKSNAIRRGFTHLMDGRTLSEIPKFVGFVDCDGAFSISDICSAITLSMRSEWSILIGSRVQLAQSSIERSKTRHLIGRAVATLTNYFVLPNTIYDMQSGLKIFKVSEHFLDAINLPFKTRWFGDVELYLRLCVNGPNPVYELPIASWTEISGGKLSLRNVFEIAHELISLIMIKNSKRC